MDPLAITRLALKDGMIAVRRFPIFYLASVLAVLLLAIAPSAAAKGNFDKVVVYGDGVAVLSFDPSLLAFEAFNSFSNPYPGTPSVIVEGYLIVRYAQDQRTGEYIPVDSLRFFPTSLSSGSKPFVYYEGLVNGASEYDHKWYEAKPEAVGALQRLLDAEAQPSSPRWLGSSIAFALSGLAGIAIGMIVMALARARRTTEHRSPHAGAQPSLASDRSHRG